MPRGYIREPRRALSAGLAVALALGGLVEIGSRVSVLGSDGLLSAARDPGTTLNYLVLTPIAAFLLVSYFPAELVRSRSRRLKDLAYILGTAGFLVGWVIVNGNRDAVEGFCSRLPGPADVGDESTRNQLLKIRASWFESLTAEDGASSAIPASLQGETETSRSCKETLPCGDYLECYESVVSCFRSDGCSEDPDAFYSENATTRKSISTILTIGSLLIVVGILWVFLFHLWILVPPTAPRLWALVLATVVLACWIPARMVSNWQLGLGQAAGQYPPVKVGVVALVAVAGAVFAYRISGNQAAKMAIAGLVAAVGGLVTVATAVPTLLAVLAREWVMLDLGSMVGVLFVVGAGLLLIVRYIARHALR